MRDTAGNVLCHSRRAFSQVKSNFEAKVNSWEWALQCMKDMKYLQNVTFAAAALEIIKALHEPLQWPSFLGHIAGLLKITSDQSGWDISFEEQKCNMGAFEIAKIVVIEDRLQSYV